jgi:hypothetical protein
MAGFIMALVEGTLEEPMARRLMKEVGIDAANVKLAVAGGCENFWRRAPSYNEAARHFGFVLGLTDLDQRPCPSELISEKLGGSPHPRFTLRIQVRELESWLLADHVAWSQYLKVSSSLVPRHPDSLADPKLELVNLVRRCNKKTLREDFVPQVGTPRVVGPGYTSRITEFIWKHWSPRRASERSPSLQRALQALEKVARQPA